MSTVNNPAYAINSTLTGNNNLIYNSTPLIRSPTDLDNLIEYVDLLYSIVGVDIKFEGFCNMSESERKSFIRQIKIEKIINKDDNNRSR